MRRAIIFLALFFPLTAVAQQVRYDAQATQALVAGGAISSVAAATIALCNSPANAVPCTNKATNYASASGSACPTATQLVLAGTTTCVAATDGFGNWGVWVPSGEYEYTVTTASGSSGPFHVSVPRSSSASVWTTAQSFGTASQAYFSGLGPVTFQGIGSLFADPAATFVTHPDIYISHLSTSTGTTNCLAAFLGPCDLPSVRVDFTNQQTGGPIPGLVGIECGGHDFEVTTATAVNQNYETCFGANVQDHAIPNIALLRGANFNVVVNGLPTGQAGGGQTRSAEPLELDVNNSAGADGVFNGAASGNYILGESIVANGANHSTLGLAVGSSASSGKGFLTGLDISGFANCGLCIFKGNSAGESVGITVANSGSVGISIGNVSVNTLTNGAESSGNPATGILMDSQAATNGASNTMVFRSTNGSGTQQNASLQVDTVGNFNITPSTGMVVGGNGGFTGAVNFSGASAIASAPPSTNNTSNTGWKYCYFSNTLCMGVASHITFNYLPATNFFGWGSALPANNGTATVPDGSSLFSIFGADGSLWGKEGTISATATAGYDVLGFDSTGHTLKLSSNGGAFNPVVTQTGSVTAGHLATFNASGVIQDGGVVPSSGVSEATMANSAVSGSLTACSGASCSIYILPSAHTILRIVANNLIASSGCSTQAQFGVRDVTTSTNLASITVSSSGITDSGAISVSTTAGDTLGVGVVVSSTGCSTNASAAITVTYK